MKPAPSRRVWAAVTIVLVAVNFRPAIVAVAPMFDQISDAVDLSASAAGFLLSLPVLCFGLVGPSAPIIARRFGLERTLGGVLVAVLIGSALRLVPTGSALFAGTLAIGLGIAVGNILLPALIKRDFPDAVGVMSGLYTLSITGGAALAAGLTLPIARSAGMSWNTALASWGLLALVGLAALIPGMAKPHGTAGRAALTPTATSRLLRDPLAWAVTLVFGLQSLNFYSMTTWIPTILIAYGYPPALAGMLLSLNSLMSIIPAMVTPLLMTRMKRQSGLAVVLAALCAIAILGFIWVPATAWLWVSVLGAAQGATLAMALTLIILRSPDAERATQLSGMTQSWGYALAAVGPIAIGAIFDLAQTWTVPLAILALLAIPQAIVGYQAGRSRSVGGGKADRRGAGSGLAGVDRVDTPISPEVEPRSQPDTPSQQHTEHPDD